MKQQRPTRKATKVAVLGSGSWGTVFAKVLADAGNDVQIWARRLEVATEITEAKRNSQYLPGINLPRSLRASTDLAAVCRDAEQIYLALPSQTLRATLPLIADLISDDTILVSLMKGVEKGTGQRMSQVISESLEIDPERIAVASGPNLALEIAREEPTAIVVASANPAASAAVSAAATTPYLMTFTNPDVIGTEFGGVLKNLVAVAVGIADGAGYGDNTKASIITRGLAEITAFSVAHGARPETMSGLAGLGDLIATCASPLSRNNTAGRLLGQGYSRKDVIAQMQQTAEGLASLGPVLELAKAAGVEMPLASQVQSVLNGTLDPKQIAPRPASNATGVPETGAEGARGKVHERETGGRGVVRRSLQRALDKLRDGGRGSRRD